MQAVMTISLDIAKNGFRVHGVDACGQVVIRPQLKRRNVLVLFEKLPSCLIGIEACASSLIGLASWRRWGICLRLMPPAYLKQQKKRYHGARRRSVKRSTRPDMRFCADRDGRAFRRHTG